MADFTPEELERYKKHLEDQNDYFLNQQEENLIQKRKEQESPENVTKVPRYDVVQADPNNSKHNDIIKKAKQISDEDDRAKLAVYGTLGGNPEFDKVRMKELFPEKFKEKSPVNSIKNNSTSNSSSNNLEGYKKWLNFSGSKDSSFLEKDDENKIISDALSAPPNEEYLSLLKAEKKNITDIPESRISKFLGGRLSADELADRRASEKMAELEKAREAVKLTDENLRKKYGDKDYSTPEKQYLTKLEKDLGLKEPIPSRSIASEPSIAPEESKEKESALTPAPTPTAKKVSASAPITKKAAAVSTEEPEKDPLMAAIKAESEAPKKAETDFVSLLEQAKKARNQQQLLANIGRAGETLSSAITGMVKGGVVTKPTGTDFYKDLAKQAEQGIEDVGTQYKFETAQEEKERLARRRDPGSEESKFARDLLKQQGITVPEGATAEALEKYAPQLTNILNQREAQKSREMMARERDLDRAAVLESKLEGKKLESALRLAPKIQNKQYETLSEMRSQSSLMKESLKNPNPSRDVAIIYGFVKALDPKSAVREGEIDFVQLGRSVPTKINQYFKRAFSGEILPAEARKEMADYISQREKQAYKEWEISASPYLKQADKANIDRELVAPGSTEMASPSNFEQPRDPKIEEYAKTHSMEYDQASNILRARGYGK